MGQSGRIALEEAERQLEGIGFETITKTVKPMKTVNIKGKEYVEVNERIKHFRANFTKYALTTEIVELTDKRVVMVAKVIDAGGVVISTGHAYEDKDSTFINKTSYIENCETSAIGRALGNFGIGIDTSIASAEEVQTAIANQNKPKEPNAGYNQILEIKELLINAKLNESDTKKVNDLLALKVIPASHAVNCIEFLTNNQK